MYLHSQSRKKNGKTYTYYSLAESYREGKKSKKKVLCYLGTLTPLQAQQIRNALKITQSPETFVTTFDDMLFEDHWQYLDIAFLNHLWDKKWGLSKQFPLPEETSKTRKKDISTGDIAKILTFYRCLDPGSYRSAVDWFNTTTCDLILGIDGTHFNESRIYRELTVIEQQKEKIEQYLYETLKSSDEESMRIIFYDLSDSYFEGKSCQFASPGITKANGFKNKRIVLSLLINSKGYPFSWDILEDYTADVKTLTGNADRWKQKFNLPKVIMVFDRGMVSDDNLKHLEDSKNYLYITALDKDQLTGVEGFKPERFKNFTEKTTQNKIISKGLTKYDDNTFYEDMGVDSSGRRHILVFNLDLLKDQRKAREKLIGKAIKELEEEKNYLLDAKKSRNEKPTEKRIDRILEKFKVNGYLDYSLESVVITTKRSSEVRTFNLKYKRKKGAIEKAMLTDGMWMLVTNITKTTEPEEFRLSPEKLISAYRDKNRVEEGFKEVKSFLKFRPTFVYSNDHVRAHYTICILAYLLDVTVTNRLREAPVEDVSSVRKAYSTLGRCEVAKLGVRGIKCEGKKLMPLTDVQKNILQLFNCKYLRESGYLKSIGIK
ncbi:MAG: IS1634 family transposase [Methanosarcinaceae archaeon]|nr:IS1634 family transposase [Methanosarcinaceae archaeon]